MRPHPLLLLAAFALAAAVATLLLAPRLVPGLRGHAPARLAALPSLASVTAWRNTPPLAPDSLRGHAVALMLWSDTDPRAAAALQVADLWHRSLGPLGVQVLAIHEPEFDFATDTTVAFRFARHLGLALPMADDPECRIEAALGGATDGPHLVVADASGAVRVDTVGDLVAGEAVLRAAALRSHPAAALPPAMAATLPGGVRTVWLGAGRVEGGPLRDLSAGHTRVFTAEFRYQEQGRAWTPYPVGGWRTGTEGVTSTRGGAANFMAIRYSAGRAGVVVTPPAGQSARVWILRDDRWPDPEHRDEDVVGDALGTAWIEVREPRIYWIDRGGGDRVIKLSPELAGVTLNAFVFTDAR
jgi:hypothetical protein